MVSRKGKSTRKSKVLTGKLMNIPELKESFGFVDKATHELLKEGLDEKECIKKFQALWKSVFHRSVSAEAAKAFLELKRAASGKTGKTGSRKLKAQKGGASTPLGGAPLDYTTRPGVDGVYGSFPKYVVSGLDSYDKFNQIGMDSDPTRAAPVVPRSIGSNDVV
jgi:hypothetical protein